MKKILALLLAAVMCLSFFGCGKKSKLERLQDDIDSINDALERSKKDLDLLTEYGKIYGYND